MNNIRQNTKALLLNYTGGKIRDMLKTPNDNFYSGVTEVRIRADKPLIIKKKSEEWFIDRDGCPQKQPNGVFCPAPVDIALTVEMVSQYSMYAFEEELRNGYITIPGGNRIGICGSAVIENGHIKTIKNINALNIRLAHEIKGCANSIMRCITAPPRHTLIVSPPARGKTTLLRDIIRQLSDGGYAVGVADERGELAACYRGVPQNDIGIRTDVLDACPKAEAMILLLRSMSPQIIAADEIGKEEDIRAIGEILNAGVKLICTIHGESLEDASKKLGSVYSVFERFILLKATGSPGSVEGVYDESHTGMNSL